MHRLSNMMYRVTVRQGLTMLSHGRTKTAAVPLFCASMTLNGTSSRAFSLWEAKTTNEDARKAIFEHGEALASSVKSASHDVQQNLADVGPSIHDRIAHAENAISSAVGHESEAISQAAETASTELKALGLGGYSPSGLLQQLLDAVQYYTDLPWWATIIAVTCGIRLAIAPLIVYVQGNSIRLSNIQPQMQDMIKDMEYAKSTGNQQEMQSAAMKVRKLLSDNNCSPFKSLLLPLVQMPVFLSFYFALDRLAKAPLPALTTGGVAWFPDLTVADPYYALPAISTIMTLLVLETGAETGTTAMNQSQQARIVKYILRGVTVLAAWFISSFPSALLLYWSTTNTFSLAQLLLLRTKFMKRLLRLPTKIEHPVKPHVKQKSFMENIRSSMNNARTKSGDNASSRRPEPAPLYRKSDNTSQNLNQSRSRALDALMADATKSKQQPSNVANELNHAEKQSRLAAARERRLRQRS